LRKQTEAERERLLENEKAMRREAKVASRAKHAFCKTLQATRKQPNTRLT